MAGPSVTSVTSPLLVGFLACLALIAAIGAQNAFVLRQGIRREHVLPVVVMCTLSDMALVAAGIAGVGALISAHPGTLAVAKYGGAAFLLCYGLLAAKRAWRPSALTPTDAAPTRLLQVLGTCAALTFLNPHVYSTPWSFSGRWPTSTATGVGSSASVRPRRAQSGSPRSGSARGGFRRSSPPRARGASSTGSWPPR